MSFKLGTASILALASMTLTGQEANAYWGVGFCDPFGPATKKNFELSDYAGNWYEIKRDKDLWYENNVECVTASYEYAKD